MQMKDYPALFHAADGASAVKQKLYLGLICSQFFLLILISVSATPELDSPAMRVLTLVTLLISLGLMVYLANTKPEQDWYRARALSESIKTATWRFMMRAEPFGAAQAEADTMREFRGFLTDILAANRQPAHNLNYAGISGEQITQQMRAVRAQPLEERRQFYLTYRIRDQQTWYTQKARSNRRAFRFWAGISFLAYGALIIICSVRILTDALRLVPLDALLVAASSILGWIQIKKFNELASSYALTSHEIGLVESRLDDATTEAAFELFVNDAEQAFSREHTQWVARQQQDAVNLAG